MKRFVVFVFILTYGIGWIPLETDIQVLFLLVAFAMLSAFPFIFHSKDKLPWIADPGIWCMINYFILYGSGAYQEIFNNRGGTFTSSDYVVDQLRYTILCSFFFYLGYFKNNQNIKSVLKFDFNRAKVKRLLIYCFMLFVAGRLFAVFTGRYYHDGVNVEDIVLRSSTAGVEQVFFFFSRLEFLLIIILGYLAYEKKLKLSKAMFVFLAILFALIEAPSGSKERVIMPFVIAVGVYSLFTLRTPTVFILGFSFSVLFVVFPLFQIYRSDPDAGFGNAVEEYGSSFDLSDTDELAKTGNKHIGERLNGAGIQAKIMSTHDNGRDFLYGSGYLDFFIGLVPRIVWPNKPSMSSGNVFGQEYGFLSQYDDITSVGRYWQGEAYINFSWFGCLMGFLIGRILGFAKKYLDIRNNLLGLFMFYIIGYSFLRADQIISVLDSILKCAIFYYLIFYPFLVRFKKISPIRKTRTFRPPNSSLSIWK